MSKKYTFDDWLNGRSVNWPQIYLKQGEEFTPEQIELREQIENAKEQAWGWLIELNTEYWIEKLENESEGFIEAFKKEKKRFFDDNLDLVKRYEKKQTEGIDHIMYKKLKVLYEKYHKQGGYNIGVTNQKNGKGYPGRLQDIYVFKNVLKHLEKRPDPQTEKIINIAIHGRKVQKQFKKHAREYLRSYSRIKRDQPGLSISGYIQEVGMTKLSDNSYREWIEKFNEAEQMFLNDD